MRLIDANTLFDKAEGKYKNSSGLYRQIYSGFLDDIADAPTVDAVEVKCKVGDLVHALWEAPVKQKYIIYCAEVKEIRIAMRNYRLTTTYILEPIEYRCHRREYRDDDFEKIVFRTEEAAKAALAKMDGGNGNG